METKTKSALLKFFYWLLGIFVVAVLLGWLAASLIKPQETVSQVRQDTVQLLTKDLEKFAQFGNPAATLTIMEFGDFQCPYCYDDYERGLRPLLDKYQDKINFVWRDFPLETLHPMATLAAKGGVCAQEQDKFWQYHDLVFRNQKLLSEEFINNIPQTLGLDADKFSSCLSKPEVAARINDDYLLGTVLGAKGTPTFFVNGVKVAGVVPSSAWIDLIEKFLAKDTLNKK